MTVQEFLETTTFEADDLIVIVTPTGLPFVVQGDNPTCNHKLANAQIAHHHTRKECERAYHRVHIA